MMYKKKLQVFVSSTYTDLIEERQAAVEAILIAGHIPAGMELFAAGDESQLNVIKRWIDESDVYLLILGGRYGSVEEVSGKSYTQIEYEYAISNNKPIFAIVADDNYIEEKVKRLGTHIIEKEYTRSLREFKADVLKKMVRFYKDTKDIKLAILETMSEFSRREELKGWIPGNQGLDTGVLAEEIARLTKENYDLRNKINERAIASEPTYNSLTFSQVTELLKMIEVEVDSASTNLFEFFLTSADTLVRGVEIHRQKQEANNFFRLVEVKIATFRYSEWKPDYIQFEFTEDGHKFYLMALIQIKNDTL